MQFNTSAIVLSRCHFINRLIVDENFAEWKLLVVVEFTACCQQTLRTSSSDIHTFHPLLEATVTLSTPEIEMWVRCCVFTNNQKKQTQNAELLRKEQTGCCALFFIEITTIVLDREELPITTAKSATTLSCKLEQPRMDFIFYIRQTANPKLVKFTGVSSNCFPVFLF